MSGRADEFLSEEDLDLRHLPDRGGPGLVRLWLRQAQAGNDHDWHLYSHGVFTVDPRWKGPPPPRDRFL